MQNYLKKKARIASFIFAIEVAALATLFVLEYRNMFLDYLFNISIAATVVFMIINLFLIFTILVGVSKAKIKSDVKAIDIVGSDIQDIYNFGKLGFIITDDNNKVIWTNDFFPQAQKKLIDKDILELKPDLVQLKIEDDAENKNPPRVVIDFENHSYEAVYKKSAQMFILKDVSELESMTNYNNNHSPCLGIISIDDYAEISAALNEMELNDIMAQAQKLVVDYAAKYKLYLRKYRNDSYMAICTHKSFMELMDDKFSIVQQIKDNAKAREYELTVSIGFAVGFDDYNELSSMAETSLNLALSRGGNQAVIFPYGKNFVFFGGKSEAKSKRNQSRIRVLSQSLSAIIKDADDVYIMGHKDADLDAIGSSLGLYHFALAFNKKVKVVYDENLVENKTRRAFKTSFSKEEIKEITITSVETLKAFKKNSLLIITDVSRPSICMSPELVEKAIKIAVIDHHRRAEEFVTKPLFVHIEPSASSASELVVELIRYCSLRVLIPSNSATMMLAGILLDTNYYRNKTGTITYDASLVLKEFGADNQLADSFLKAEYNEYALKTKIMANSYTPYTGIVLATSDNADIIDRSILAIVAQETLAIQGIKACFVIGRTSEDIVSISARSDGSVNCQMLMEKLNGGGHFAAAATQIKGATVEEAHNKLKEVLNQHINDVTINSN